MAWIRRAPSGRWRAEWRDPDGRKRSRTFPRKADAQRYLTGIEASKISGGYADPALGRMALRAFWPQFLQASPHLRLTTRSGYEALWRRHIEPHLGGGR